MSGFQQVAKSIGGVSRTSALFYYLQNTGTDNLLIADGVVSVSEPTISRSAYIISLELCGQDNIFAPQGYTMRERHARIDKDFTKLSNKALNHTHWHYTETYVKTDSKDITVHVYFHYGLFLASTFKMGDGTPQQLTMAQVSIARKNVGSALNIILELLQAVSSRKQALNSEYETMANKLSDTAYVLELEHSDTINSALAACGRVFRELQEYNEDYIDSRFDQLTLRITSIIEQYNKFSSTTVKEVVEGGLEQSKSVAQVGVAFDSARLLASNKARIEKTPDEIYIETLKAMHIKLDQYCKALNAATAAPEILRLAALKQDFNEQLVILYFEASNEQYKKRVNTYEKLLNNTPSVFSKFKQFAIDGKSEAAIALFNHVQDSIPSTFYLEFLLEVTSPFQKVDSEQGHVALCKLFYDSAVDYRILMSMFNTLQTGIPSEDGSSVLFSQNILNGSMSIGRFDIFKILCEQSTLNNICGAIIEGEAISLLDLACSVTPNDDRFVKYLLERGAIPDYPNQRFSSLAVPINQSMQHSSATARDKERLQRLVGNLNLHNIIRRTYDHGNNTAASFDMSDSALAAMIPAVRKRYREIVNAGSTLTRYISFAKQDPLMIARLARDTSTSNLIFALARLCVKDIGFMLGFAPEKVGVKIVKTKEQRGSHVMADMQNCGTKGASFISYFLGEGKMPQAMLKLHAIHDQLSTRLAVTSEANLKRYHNEFQNLADKFEKQDDILHAITANYASLFTLCYVEPSSKVHLTVAAILVSQTTLYSKESFDFLDKESKRSLQYASMVNLQNLSNISRYRSELQNLQFDNTPASNQILRRMRSTLM